MDEINFNTTFAALTGNPPFPWQWELYQRFVAGDIPTSCNLPTGLGKTSVIHIWLLALAYAPLHRVPRRLVYVVNRRTVVDQSTEEARKLRDRLGSVPELNARLHALCAIPCTVPLAISTLRGQFADNREWSADPARPAVIAGTVDMIGSRLLFSGYGCGFKSRPLHAGFLGQDVLLVHDEAHLEPAFQELLEAILQEQQCSKEFGIFRVMELSATSRTDGAVFQLTAKEQTPPETIPNPPAEPLHHVWRRQKAKKALQLHANKDDKKLAEEIADLALQHRVVNPVTPSAQVDLSAGPLFASTVQEPAGRAVLVFVRTLDDVNKVVKKLPKGAYEQLTGTLRGKERDDLIKKPIFQRFLPLSNRAPGVIPTEGTVYLVCTSAGEVGVNISADDLVCDLSTFESMAQRFGRVNRFGDRTDTRIDVVYPNEFEDTDEIELRRQKTLELLRQLNGDGSPAALSKLKADERLAAFSPKPCILPASDILFDAWALTTIRSVLPGRPPVAPYLHGISPWEPPQTQVAWRSEVWELRREFADNRERELFQKFAQELLEDYPLKAHELLKERSDRVLNALKKFVAHPATPVWIVDEQGALVVTSLGEVVERDKEALNYKTVLLPPQAGGLEKGLLDATSKYDSERMDYDVADEWSDANGPLRRRSWDDTRPTGMKLERVVAIRESDDDDAEPTKTWYWYVRPNAADNPNARSSRVDGYDLHRHLNDAKDAATRFVTNLAFDADLRQAVILAAEFHDLGKDRKLWQQGIGNGEYPAKKWAKSGQRMAATERSTYRHEFGSLLDVAERPEFLALTPELKDLVLHLIAAHHGRARPHFSEDEAFDHEPKGRDVAGLTAAVPGRFATLQRRYGRWGLAYLESLVRAADIHASQQADGGTS